MQAALVDCGAVRPAAELLLESALGYEGRTWRCHLALVAEARLELATLVRDLAQRTAPHPKWQPVRSPSAAVLEQVLRDMARVLFEHPFAVGTYLVKTVNSRTRPGSGERWIPESAIDDQVLHRLEAHAAADVRRAEQTERERRRRCVREQLAALGAATQLELAITRRVPGATLDERGIARPGTGDVAGFGPVIAARLALEDALAAHLDGDRLPAAALTLLQETR